jgi:hypothetical protein
MAASALQQPQNWNRERSFRGKKEAVHIGTNAVFTSLTQIAWDIKLTAAIIVGWHCYQLHKKLYLSVNANSIYG